MDLFGKETLQRNLKTLINITIELVPTNPNCHLVQQIGLAISYRLKL